MPADLISSGQRFSSALIEVIELLGRAAHDLGRLAPERWLRSRLSVSSTLFKTALMRSDQCGIHPGGRHDAVPQID